MAKSLISKSVIFLCLLFVMAGTSWAAGPIQGFGLMVGSIDTERSWTGGSLIGSSGTSLGVDYQWAMSDVFSVNLFLHSSSETYDTPFGLTGGHGAFGVGIRIWPSDTLFVGAHIGNYSEVITDGFFTISGAGGGGGVTLGLEFDNGWFLALQHDEATIEYSDPFIAPTDIATNRFHIGYRWGAK